MSKQKNDPAFLSDSLAEIRAELEAGLADLRGEPLVFVEDGPYWCRHFRTRRPVARAVPPSYWGVEIAHLFVAGLLFAGILS